MPASPSVRPTMRAVYFEAHGGPEVVRVGELPTPAPGPGEALIRVDAAALNHLDLWVRGGLPGITPALPHVCGSDAVGEIAAFGPDLPGDRADAWAVGDRVLLNPGVACRQGDCRECAAGQHSLCPRFQLLGEHLPGTFAEYVAAPVTNLWPAPPHLSSAEAAALPLAFLTAWRMLVTRGRLRAGEDVLIVGIGGGVATAALVIARHVGARALVTSGSEAKLARAIELGAAAGADHHAVNVARWAREQTDGRGVDVVVDSVGGDGWSRSLGALARGGRLVTCGATAGARPQTHIQRIFWNQLEVIGSTMGADEDIRAMLDAVREGALRPVVDGCWPLEEAPAALGRLEEGAQLGKLVLTVRER